MYCFAIKRNTKRVRSEFNSTKTSLLRPSLYNEYKKDKSISFVYSSELRKEKSDNEIMEN